MPCEFGPWHKWFAWHPVETANYGWKWFKRVERRRWRCGPNLEFGYYRQRGWDYRLG